ncbi:ribosome small subunit-dependent GTPase A [Numidum massiliense]|uniref:ribosome small subunit-dependent GTPase A n=1 Tax=Numidum massiliense TaxID=1522315 RepID=UPI0006D53921|nr:ribosome small subunit-dependent GTPase A [Numidum massiliense]
MPEGRIVKALSGYYYVQVDEELWQCRARGLFKKKQFSPLVGDWVSFDITEEGQGYIHHVVPRETELKRPAVANANQGVIVASLAEPVVQLLLIDKLLVHIERARLKPLIVLTKTDLSPSADAVDAAVRTYEKVGYPVVTTSVVSDAGLEELREALASHISVFAGQSGVGKTSLLNALIPNGDFATGEISAKLGRGRHTTRHVEMVVLPSGGWIVDTPGFSQLSFQGWDAAELTAYFPEIARFAANCKYRGCLHDREPGCAVKRARESGAVSASRYDNYLQFLQEIQEEKRY